MHLKLKDNQPLLLNLLIGGIIGITFGLATRQVLPWTAGGLLIGGVVGSAAQRLFRRWGLTGRKQLRGLLVLTLLETLAVLYVLLPTMAAESGIHPVRLPVKVTPEELEMTYEPVSLTTQDGLTLRGWYIPGTNRAAVIALHGLNGNRTHVVYHAKTLNQVGFGVLALDMRAQGESEGEVFDWYCYQDVIAGLRYLQTRPDVDPQRIGALGLSAGAEAIIFAASFDPGLKAIWVDGAGLGDTSDALDPMLPYARKYFFSTPLNWMYFRMTAVLAGHSSSPAFKTVVPAIAPRHAMFVGAGKDPVEPDAARRYASLAGPNASAWVIPNVGHVSGIFGASEEYQKRLVDFFTQALLIDYS